MDDYGRLPEIFKNNLNYFKIALIRVKMMGIENGRYDSHSHGEINIFNLLIAFL